MTYDDTLYRQALIDIAARQQRHAEHLLACPQPAHVQSLLHDVIARCQETIDYVPPDPAVQSIDAWHFGPKTGNLEHNERNQPMKQQQAYQAGLFEPTVGPPDLIAECGILSPAMRQIVGAANLSPARQLQVLAELANGQTTARSLNARVATLARQQAQGAADGDQMAWGR